MLCVAWSPDAAILATGGMDSSLWLWDPRTGRALGTCKGEHGSLNKRLHQCLGFWWKPNLKCEHSLLSDVCVTLCSHVILVAHRCAVCLAHLS